MHQYDNTGYPYRVGLGVLYMFFLLRTFLIKEGSSIKNHITSVVLWLKIQNIVTLKKKKNLWLAN